MPYRSEAQRGYMHVHHPAIAARWDRKYGGKIVPSKKKRKRDHEAGGGSPITKALMGRKR
jgi:hypothetical protein